MYTRLSQGRVSFWTTHPSPAGGLLDPSFLSLPRCQGFHPGQWERCQPHGGTLARTQWQKHIEAEGKEIQPLAQNWEDRLQNPEPLSEERFYFCHSRISLQEHFQVLLSNTVILFSAAKRRLHKANSCGGIVVQSRDLGCLLCSSQTG